LDYDEREEGSNKELTVNYGLSSRHHQVVAEDENGNYNVRVSLSLQYVRNGQLVAPIEITFYGLSDD
jgi:lipopolysaccharide/colanic/teichoic acid biosynthesis glycosyltransferase